MKLIFVNKLKLLLLMDKGHMRVSKQKASVKDQVVQQHALVKNRLRERRQ